MCSPAAVLTAGSVALQTGAAITQNRAQAQASRANALAAERAKLGAWQDIGLRQMQEQEAAGQTIMQADRQARSAAALAGVSAGEAGVAGVSVDALLSDFAADAATARVGARRNLAAVQEQLQREKVGAVAQAAARKASVPPPSWLLTGLQIGSAVTGAVGQQMGNKP